MLFEKSVDTKVIEAILGEAAIGQVITYAELSKAIGRDVREHAMSALQTARRSLQKEKGFVFSVERGEGVVRLNDSQIVATSEFDRRRIQKISTRSLDKLSKVTFDKLDDVSKKQHLAASAQLGALAMFSTSQSAKKIAGKVEQTQAVLPVGETLKLFGG